jgi:hypothetical protein
MCFSAEASFGASAVILTIGIVCIKKSKNPPQRILSSIPFLFGTQQFCEGMLWLSLSHPGLTQWVHVTTYLFLFFAQIVWPIIIPFAILLIEQNKTRIKILKALLAIGIIISCYLGISMIIFNVHADILCYHILYTVDYPIILQHKGFFYLIPTLLPLFISSIKRLRLFGALIFFAFIVAKIFFAIYLVSVWCFFAAITSVFVLLIINKLNKDKDVKFVLQD